MEAPQNDFDRLFIFELDRKTAEANYFKNPLDAENLTRWGRALLELAQFQNEADSVKYIKDGISRLEEALEVSPRRAETLWYLGSAHTSNGFYIQDHDPAMNQFRKATQYFKEAVEEDPGNDKYMKSLDLSLKAPELHMEFQRQMASQTASVRIGGSSTSNLKEPNKKTNSDLKYDILGWVILAVGFFAWIGMAKSHVPPPAPR